MTIPNPESIDWAVVEPGSLKRTAANGKVGRFAERLEEFATRINTRPKLLFITLTLVYTAIALPIAYLKPLWHDELITLDLASLPTVSRMLQSVRLVDLNPPVLYLLNYVTIRIPGAHMNDHVLAVAARLPSIASGLLASIGLLFILRRRIGPLWAAAAVGLYWNTPFFSFVIEDRPYALVSGLIVALILAWERASQAGRNLAWVALTLLLGLAIMGSHFMSGVVLGAFIAATIAVGLAQRRIDIPLLISYIVPFAIPLAYYAKITGYGTIVFPFQFQPTWIRIPVEYAMLVGFNVLVLGALMAVYAVSTFLPPSEAADSTLHRELSGRLKANSAEVVLLAGILLQPTIALIAIMRVHGAFFLRYGLPGCIPIAILLTAFIYALFHGAKYAALLVVLVSALVPLLLFGGTRDKLQVDLPKEHAGSFGAGDYHSVETELPFVVASGLTYVEMNHREPVDFLNRVYYLTDTDAAIQYAHATLFEHEAEVREMFHYPARVEALKIFEAEHPRFLVLGTVDYPEDWLLRKLIADGEDLRLVGIFKTSYKDRGLYEVTLKQVSK